MSEAEQPPSESSAPQAPPEPSPATIRLRAAREWFARNFTKSLPRTKEGAVIIDPLQVQLDHELDGMRVSALAQVLVDAGVITAEQLSDMTATLIEESNEKIGQIIVANRIRGQLNGHGG